MKEQFIRLAADCLGREKFRLLDIGCSGGIDPAWRAFEPRLQALGIDASASECRRLAELERNADIAYVAAFVGGAADRPVAAHPTGAPLGTRLSFWRAREFHNARLREASTQEKLRYDAWELTRLADPAKPVVAPDLLADRGWTGLDYLKVDVDGADFEILQSFRGCLGTLGVIAVQLEVNFVGTGVPDEHSFHNTDRFMRRHGYQLIRLDTRTYSMAALPARFATTAPAQTVSGRLFQGDAYYARDPIASGEVMSAAQLLKLAAIFSVWDQPDGAAEILVTFRDRIAPLLDVDAALDMLAAQSQPDEERPLSYREYMARFAEDAPLFYPPPPLPPWQPAPRPTFLQRIQAAWHSVSDWSYIEKLMGDLEERRRS